MLHSATYMTGMVCYFFLSLDHTTHHGIITAQTSRLRRILPLAARHRYVSILIQRVEHMYCLVQFHRVYFGEDVQQLQCIDNDQRR